MNELSNRYLVHPEWALRYDEADRLVVESLVRRGFREIGRLELGPEHDDLLIALLELVRSVRLDHVALSLDAGQLSDELDPAVGASPARLVDALLSEGSLARALIDVVDLGDDAAGGHPVVVSLVDGRARYAHIRRLAACEDRLARALIASARDDAPSTLARLDADRVLEGVEAPLRTVMATVLKRRVGVLTGGPGTGKTTLIARVLHRLGESARDQRVGPITVALCAPTAKAAVRLIEAVEASFAERGDSVTGFADVLVLHPRSGSVHRLLSLRPDLAYLDESIDADVVIVDEVSMLELPLLDQLVARTRHDARILLVGDPDQLASVNVGAALRDIVDAAETNLAPIVAHLTHNYRSGLAVQDLAEAVNAGDLASVQRAAAAHADALTLGADLDRELERARTRARELADLANENPSETLVTLARHVILAATREGRGSVAWWNDRLAITVGRGEPLGDAAPGTPVLVTRNEAVGAGGFAAALNNGDVGVVVNSPAGGLEVLFAPASSPRRRRIGELGDVVNAWALTIHKSQGSEYDEVVISLPIHDVTILTRELLYTAITRARSRVTIIANDATLERTISRRISRVSALVDRVAAIAQRDGGARAQ